MPVVNFELEKGKYILVHKCQKCGMEKKNRLEKNDNMDTLIKLSETIAKKLMFWYIVLARGRLAPSFAKATKGEKYENKYFEKFSSSEVLTKQGRLAQLVRAPRLHRGGHRFESYTAHHICSKFKKKLILNGAKN